MTSLRVTIYQTCTTQTHRQPFDSSPLCRPLVRPLACAACVCSFARLSARPCVRPCVRFASLLMRPSVRSSLARSSVRVFVRVPVRRFTCSPLGRLSIRAAARCLVHASVRSWGRGSPTCPPASSLARRSVRPCACAPACSSRRPFDGSPRLCGRDRAFVRVSPLRSHTRAPSARRSVRSLIHSSVQPLIHAPVLGRACSFMCSFASPFLRQLFHAIYIYIYIYIYRSLILL